MNLTVDPLPSLHDLTFEELSARLASSGVRPAHASALWRSLHQDLDRDLGGAGFLPPLRRWLNDQLGRTLKLDDPVVVRTVVSGDGHARKLLLRLEDGEEVETVIMGYPGRHTVCLSTQVGCAMGCVFCATGQMGFRRQLRAGEMVGQVLEAQRSLRASGRAGLRNVVLMGMGEPLHNYDAAMRALEILSDPRGANIGPSRITVSTVGVDARWALPPHSTWGTRL